MVEIPSDPWPEYTPEKRIKLMEAINEASKLRLFDYEKS